MGKARYRGVAVRQITHTPDFIDPDLRFILEVKGFATDTYKIYKKLLLHHLLSQGLEPAFFTVHTQKEAREVLPLIQQQYYPSHATN